MEMDNERCLMALTMFYELFLFDPMTGNVHSIDTENENNQELYYAIEYAMKALDENERLKQQIASLTGAYDELTLTARYLEETNDELRDHITAIEFDRACLMNEIDKLKGR